MIQGYIQNPDKKQKIEYQEHIIKCSNCSSNLGKVFESITEMIQPKFDIEVNRPKSTRMIAICPCGSECFEIETPANKKSYTELNPGFQVANYKYENQIQYIEVKSE
jgi:hypothetical protein